MGTLRKILLAASVVAFLASLTDVGSAFAWGILKPLSAILFMVFFISQLFHKEVAKYDEEFRSRMTRANADSAAAVSKPARATSSKHRRHSPLSAGAH